ncbi:MAG: efflux RND transporter periplasmic adaptor subunit [Sedimentisphaerales bacterium]|jgi:multidrug efflux system membrane fusion protein
MRKTTDLGRHNSTALRVSTAERFNLLVVLCSVVLLVSCSRKPANQGQAVSVVTATVEQKTVPIEIRNFGTVDAYSTVAIKSQITGVLTDVHFKEGQLVQKDALLLSIDSRPYEAALKSAQASLRKDEAQLQNAEKEMSRWAGLLKQGFTSQEQYDQTVTTAESLRAAVEADKANVENAKLQVDYCSIQSPIEGLAGMLLVQQGNLVKADDVTVVTINQVKPIYVTFSVPQQHLPQIQKYMAAGRIEVAANPPQAAEQPAVGWLSFIDNSIDNNTGTIRLRATFDNEDMRLWPGQFVDVKLILTQEPNAIVIPSQAIQTSQKGDFVFVVKSDQTVEQRPVTIERRINNEAVVKGLEAGEIVVTDGQLNLVPGTKTQAKNPVQK